MSNFRGRSTMLKQIEGSRAIAQAVALCRPEVVCAYPITPQTHIVEALGEMVKSGELTGCEYLNVESEFAALSAAIGAAASGARSYTATASQGLLYMAEAVYNAAGLGFPIVMTVGNRAIGAPINIWNDHSDSMALRDAGWIQLHAETNQEAVDLHIQAFRLGEALACPVMVCVDGFILTHAYERVNVPSPLKVDRYLPVFEPAHALDCERPVSIGAIVGPDAYFEVRYLQHHKQLQALEAIPQLAREFAGVFGRRAGGLVRAYRCQDADTVVVALGSLNGTIKEAVDDLRAGGVRIGALSVCTYRPFPAAAACEAVQDATRVVVVEKSLTPGAGGPLASDVREALTGLPVKTYGVIAGLGGRPITKRALIACFDRASADTLEPLTFLDLRWDVVVRELARPHEKPQPRAAVEPVRAVAGGHPSGAPAR
jgi:pyruvate ferredoxin oxidoreductase alpha subunit